MDLGLNGLGMSADDLLAVRERGWKLVRFTTWSLGDDAARIGSAIAEARLAGLWPVVVVRDAGQLRDLGTALAGCDVELANEPDGNVDVHIPPTDYAEMARNAAVIAYENGCQLWIGAISNVSGSALAWLEKMLEALGPVPVIGISAHVYEAPDWPRFLSLVGDRRWICTEFGYHTGKQPPRWRWLPKWWPGNCATYTDADVFRLATQRMLDIQAHGALSACYYQYRDGLTTGDQDRFGIRRCDPTGSLTTGKPVAELPR